ncbi:AlkZ-related protein [Alkaliphilus peptidifermentans]|uniref:Uncharacterized protein n=1 Tax=Alkaliphilus peptidifermentans DSM 18978 TaxID=1120976 RepID=A0A1G5KZ45_9FIRM|nr:hypothetical protein [Alkaliphilus peptidifermentans]SCZ05846.1 hypothetical protein SAMN03080606_03905 [Alkaliphilus peptidifermentans DSM 18978]
MDQFLQQVQQLLNNNGFIMLNENQKYPSICEYGGGWQEAIYLINTRKVFLTKLIEDKSTFISPKLYYAIRACQGLSKMKDNERYVYEFIQLNEPVDMKFIRLGLPIEVTELKKAMKTLQNKLMITAIGEAKSISNNWGVYLWGTSETWERESKGEYIFENPQEIIVEMLAEKISDNKLKAIIMGT